MTVVAANNRVNRPYFFIDNDGDRMEFPSFGHGQGNLIGDELRMFRMYVEVNQLEQAAPRFPPIDVDPPVITGTLSVGNTITVSNGTWGGSPPITFEYEWNRSPNGTTSWSVLGWVDGNAMELATADVEQYIRCKVTATNVDGSTSINSNVVGPITLA